MMTGDVVKQSSRNPFRTPTVTPSSTGAVTAAFGDAHKRFSTRRSHSQRERPSADDIVADLEATTLEDVASAEPPPAYTPAANPYDGEATVEYGPHRPFHAAPAAPPLPRQFTGMSYQGSHFVTPQTTESMPMAPNSTGGWGEYPGQGGGRTGPGRNIRPPPRHPSVSGRGIEPRVSSAPAPSSSRLSDFARDFYAATPDDRLIDREPSPTPSNASSGEPSHPEHFERVRPPAGTSSSYAPPTGPPPPQFSPPNGPPPSTGPVSNAPLPASPYRPPSEPPTPRPSRIAPNPAEEWKPTNSPTPGRPLLNKGRFLLYPTGHECRKCLNTGYKNFDPSHPCRKCWEKYAKPYSGAYVYAPRSQQSQRPLPSFRPPHLRHEHSRSQPYLPNSPLLSPNSNLSRSQSAYRPCSSPISGPPGGYPGRAVSNPGPSGFAPPPPPPMQIPPVNIVRGPPPPGSMVVGPGDSRIGGRMCWRCEGSGTVSFLIFDVMNCPVCDGLGRTFQ
ncbi:hypothetical protein DFH11DRAFT_1745467 [Phellopilus nigrolimitatus]|nr:hypothetical protein DFH11DRAFT_1745467 [Phellopilus nigrolimitatus]